MATWDELNKQAGGSVPSGGTTFASAKTWDEANKIVSLRQAKPPPPAFKAGEIFGEGIKDTGKFFAKTGIAVGGLFADTMKFVSDFIARQPTVIAGPALSPIISAVSKITPSFKNKWEDLVQNTLGRQTTFAQESIQKLRDLPSLQPSAEWSGAIERGELRKLFSPNLLPETLANLGPDVLASLGTFAVSLPVGFAVSAGSVAEEINQLAQKKGLSKDTSLFLGLGTGLAVGVLDRIIPSRLFGPGQKDTFVKGLARRFGGIAFTGAAESGTEAAQEGIQLAVESTLRDDLGADEATMRTVLSAVGGALGGVGAHSILDIFSGSKNRAEEVSHPAVPSTPPPPGDSTPISRLISRPGVDKEKSLMDQMRDQGRFQRVVDNQTFQNIHTGDQQNPSPGAIFEVNNQLFITRNVEGDTLIGYQMPLDGSPSVNLTSITRGEVNATPIEAGAVRQAIRNSGIPFGQPRSQQFITNEHARQIVRRYFSEEELPVQFVERINTPEGGIALGRYTSRMITFVNNPHETTPEHEVVHGYLDLFYNEGEREAVFSAAREQSGEKEMSDSDTEEWLADRFVRYVRSRQGVLGKIKAFFERVVSTLRRAFKRVNPDRVAELFESIETRRRPASPPVRQSVQEQYFQEPDRLTAKIFTLSEITDRISVGRQFLTDLMKSQKANLKQAEYLLLTDILNTQFKDDEKIDVQAFKKAVEAELLPLDRDVLPRTFYENITVGPEANRVIESYHETIYQSPIPTSAKGVHFALLDSSFDNYFAHTRVEDLTDERTRRLIEIQSDLFQRGRLEEERTEKKTKAEPERQKEVDRLSIYSQTWWQRIIREEIRQAAVDEKKVLLFPTGETAMKIEGLGETTQWNANLPDGIGGTNFLRLALEDLKVGQEIIQGARPDDAKWIITDVLGDGKFIAVPDHKLNSELEDAGIAADTMERVDAVHYAKRHLPDFLQLSQETFDISGKTDPNNPIFRFYEGDVGPYLARLRKGNYEIYTDENDVSWYRTIITQEDIGPVLAFQRAEDIPEEDWEAMKETGIIPDSEAILAADETVAAYQIDEAIGPAPEPKSIPQGKAADLEYRRHLALEAAQTMEAEEATEKAMLKEHLETGLDFPDSEMNNNFDRFRKLAGRQKWMLDTATDIGAINSKLGDQAKNLFENTLELTDDEVLEQFKSRYITEKELVDRVKQKTAAEVREIARRVAQKVIRDHSIKRQERLKTTITRINIKHPKTEITLDETKLLQNRLRAMAQGSKFGYAEGKRFMKDELIQKFRTDEQNRLEIMSSLADYMGQNLPPAQRGRFNKALAKVQDIKTAWKIMDQVDRIADRVAQREAIEEFKLLSKHVKGRNIAVEFVERANEIINSYDAKKPTETTLRRLKAMADYLEREKTHRVPGETIATLRRLSAKPLAEMTASDFREVNAEIERLIQQGKLKLMLENIHDERVWALNMKKLSDGTINRDPPATENTKKDRFKKAFIVGSDIITSPFRVFDAMDGDVEYTGMNVAQWKKLRFAIQKSELGENMRKIRVLKKLEEKGIKDVSEESQLTIIMHLAKNQGQDAAVETTLKKNELNELRDLTEREEIILQIVQEEIASETGWIASIFEEFNNQRFPEVVNYFPQKYEGEARISDEQAVLRDRFARAGVEKGLTKERLPSVYRPLRGDLFGVLFQAIGEQERYIHVEPVIREVASLVLTQEYKESAGIINANYWRMFLDVVSRGGESSDALKLRDIDPYIRQKRFQISTAILGFRWTTIALQPFAIFQAYGVMSQRYGPVTSLLILNEMSKTFLVPGYAKSIKEESPSLQLREGGDVTIEELSNMVDSMKGGEGPYEKAKNKFVRGSLFVMKGLDMRTAAATDQAVYRILRAQGMRDADARREADFVMDLTNASSQLSDKPLFFAMGEGARAFSIFQTWALNEWGVLTHDIVKTGLWKGDYQTKMRATFALIILLAGKMAEQWMRVAITNLFRREENNKEMPSFGTALASGLLQTIPFFGYVASSALAGYKTEAISSPIATTLSDIIYQPLQVIIAKKPETKAKAALRAGEALATWRGIPGVPLLLSWIRGFIK